MFQDKNTNSQQSQQVLTVSNYDVNQLELTDEELLHVVGGATLPELEVLPLPEVGALRQRLLELGIDVEEIEQFVRDLFGW
ncbi:hypothetical protein NIES4103_41660 [Nostoc sp. NIES-4103]|nr:hypothetical protein NIES4103_41660 [Nostoc sp. NIES-4103]